VTDDAVARKAQLRAAVLAARLRLTGAAQADAGAAIADHGLARWHGVETVAAYQAVGSEPPTAPLLDALLASGARLLLPVVDGFALDWAAYTGPNDLTPGRFGLSEPTSERLGAQALAQADVVVVPALAVDHLGNRLGRGLGFYDRALIEVAAPIVAVVYEAELIQDVPAEAHDRRVDAVLRPDGFTSLS
jgi:5-formyltetrahydrofolate cyclo-ligase